MHLHSNQANVASKLSLGFAHGTNEFSLRDSQDSIDNAFYPVGGHIINLSATANRVHAELNSMDSDGFTLGWEKTGSPTGTATMQYLAFR